MTPFLWVQARVIIPPLHGEALWFWFAMLLWLLVMALTVYAAVYAWAKRLKDLAAWAAGRDLTFRREKVFGLDDQHPGFSCLSQGDNRFAYNVIEGQWNGWEMLGFDYHYVGGYGRQPGAHGLSAVILQSPVTLQPLFIRPKNFLDRIGEFFGAGDSDFESAEFSRRFFVKAANTRWAYKVLHPRGMEFLSGQPPFSIEFEPRCAICYRERKFKAEDFETACQVLAGLLNLLPEGVIRQQGNLGRGGGEA